MELGLPGAVLFACTANSVRSPMAEALMKVMFGGQVYVDSCGLSPMVQVDAFAAAVIDEVGGDIAGHRPKGFDDLEDASFDVIISLTPEAHHRAGDLVRGYSIERLYWPTLDPTLASGSRESVLEAYRATRDQLQARIIERFGRSAGPGD